MHHNLGGVYLQEGDMNQALEHEVQAKEMVELLYMDMQPTDEMAKVAFDTHRMNMFLHRSIRFLCRKPVWATRLV